LIGRGDTEREFQALVERMRGEVAQARSRFVRNARAFLDRRQKEVAAQHESALSGLDKICEAFEARGLGDLGLLEEVLADPDCRTALSVLIDLRGREGGAPPGRDEAAGGAREEPPRPQTATGLPEGVSRRRAVEEALAELGPGPFTATDVRLAVLARYPEASTPGLSAGVSSNPHKLLREGRLRKVEGPGRRGQKNLYVIAAPHEAPH
jgi:hypothetical protein